MQTNRHKKYAIHIAKEKGDSEIVTLLENPLSLKWLCRKYIEKHSEVLNSRPSHFLPIDLKDYLHKKSKRPLLVEFGTSSPTMQAAVANDFEKLHALHAQGYILSTNKHYEDCHVGYTLLMVATRINQMWRNFK